MSKWTPKYVGCRANFATLNPTERRIYQQQRPLNAEPITKDVPSEARERDGIRAWRGF